MMSVMGFLYCCYVSHYNNGSNKYCGAGSASNLTQNIIGRKNAPCSSRGSDGPGGKVAKCTCSLPVPMFSIGVVIEIRIILIWCQSSYKMKPAALPLALQHWLFSRFLDCFWHLIDWWMKRLLIEGTDANAKLVVTAKATWIVFLGWVKRNFIYHQFYFTKTQNWRKTEQKEIKGPQGNI